MVAWLSVVSMSVTSVGVATVASLPNTNRWSLRLAQVTVTVSSNTTA